MDMLFGGPMQVLVVDDDEDMLALFKKKLERVEADFVYFQSSIAALDSILTNKYDLVITDLKMPYKSGQELVNFLRKAVYNDVMPIIVVSGYVTQEVEEQMGDFEHIKIFSKPVPWKDFILHLQNQLVELQSQKDG